MAIYDYLPTYHQVENNNLKGLQPGFVVAQMELATAATAINVEGWKKLSCDASTGVLTGMFENGAICRISADGIVPAGTTSDDPLFIHYTEPLNTLFNGAKFFAVNVEEENPRLVQLIPGDEWMSDIALADLQVKSGRIVELTSANTQSKDDWFKVTTLPDGTTAHHYMFIK